MLIWALGNEWKSHRGDDSIDKMINQIMKIKISRSLHHLYQHLFSSSFTRDASILDM